MILEFKVKNFLSFKDEQVLSFEATSDKTSEEYFCAPVGNKNIRILKMAVLYGANASGKTNILLALDLLRDLATDIYSNKNEKIVVTPFLFDEETRNQPTEFELTFFIKNIKYLYKIILNNSEILFEELKYYPSVQPAVIYTRKTENSISSITFGKKFKISKFQKEKIEFNTLSNMSVIAAYGTVNINIPELTIIFDYFQNKFMPVISTKTILTDWAIDKIKDSNSIKGFILKLINKADFNITDFFQDKISKKLIFQHAIIQNGITKQYLLQEELESDGTMRYYELLGLLYKIITEDNIAYIDELENSIHPDLFNFFINVFLANSKHSQLIFTTHNFQFLEKDNLRKDVVWFTEKKEDGSTELYSLADLDVRKDISFLNAYKARRFGAKPILGNVFIENDNEE